MTRHQQTEFATFLLRITLGIMYLAHSLVLKLSTYTLAGTASFFVGVGLPGWLAYVTFAAEAVGGVLLILGVQTRWVVPATAPARPTASARPGSEAPRRPPRRQR